MTPSDERKYPEGTPRKHHFVPRGYLSGFCAPGTDRLSLYDRARNQFRTRQRIVDVAHIKDYYAFEDDGGKRFDIEHALGELEGEAIPVIRKIDLGERLSEDDRYIMATYAAFQFTRTPVFQNMVEDINKSMIKLVTESLFRDEEAAIATMARTEDAGSGLDPAMMVELAKNMDVEIHRNASLDAMLKATPEFAEILFQLDWVIARRPNQKTSFITTDNPFCLVPSDNSRPFRGIGLRTPGVRKVFPLSQASTLVMFEPGRSVQDRILSRDQVRETNLVVASRCQHLILGRDLLLLERLVTTTEINKRQWQSSLSIN